MCAGRSCAGESHPRAAGECAGSVPSRDLPDLSAAGLDTALASTSVRAAHGTPLLFARALAAGLAQDPAAATDRDRALDLVSVAAWRSGALGLRVDALDRLEHLDTPEQRLAAAATLGLGVDVLDEFCRRQRKDRFWWPCLLYTSPSPRD